MVYTKEEANGNQAKRRTYTTAEIRHIRIHYRDHTAAQLAQRLGRTVGSLYHFIQARPELHKQTLKNAALPI